MKKQSQIITLPKILDSRGNLTFIEENNHIPFEIKRVYWIYDVPGGQLRSGHAFINQKEFIIALSGSFDVEVDDGKIKQNYNLNRSYFGLYIPNGLWRTMYNFSTNSVTFVASSTLYSKDDYVYDYKLFLNRKHI